MSFWHDHDVEAKVISILQDVPDASTGHHLGRAFLTAYQIAIEFESRHPALVKQLGIPVGGAGAGGHNSVAQYLAGQLSRVVKADPTGPIEGGFLSNQHLHDISFNHDEKILHSSLTDSGFTLSMFRLRSKGDR